MLPSRSDPTEVNAGVTPGCLLRPGVSATQRPQHLPKQHGTRPAASGPVCLPSSPGIFFLSPRLFPSPPLSSPSLQPSLCLLQKENTLFTFLNFRHRNSLLTPCCSVYSTCYILKSCIKQERVLQLQHTPQPQEWKGGGSRLKGG